VADLVETLAAEGGKDLVQALVAGLVQLAGKVPALWRHVGRDAEEGMAKELERTVATLNAPSTNREQVVLEAQIEWKIWLRRLLTDHPDARSELEDLLSELRRETPTVVGQTQNITGNHAPAYGVMNGNIINHYHDGGRRLPDAPEHGTEPDESP
jgi:GrpB-like predicted nucleotidyltransferase (UPF0157 family)